jgi:hypothetical protein
MTFAESDLIEVSLGNNFAKRKTKVQFDLDQCRDLFA